MSERQTLGPLSVGRADGPLPECTCAMTEASANACLVHGPEASEETLAAWQAARGATVRRNTIALTLYLADREWEDKPMRTRIPAIHAPYWERLADAVMALPSMAVSGQKQGGDRG